MGWKNLASWLKGGIIALILLIIFELIILILSPILDKSLFFLNLPLLLLIQFSVAKILSCSLEGLDGCSGVSCIPNYCSPFIAIIGFIILLIIIFLIGAVIGLIAGKIKRGKV